MGRNRRIRRVEDRQSERAKEKLRETISNIDSERFVLAGVFWSRSQEGLETTDAEHRAWEELKPILEPLADAAIPDYLHLTPAEKERQVKKLCEYTGFDFVNFLEPARPHLHRFPPPREEGDM